MVQKTKMAVAVAVAVAALRAITSLSHHPKAIPLQSEALGEIPASTTQSSVVAVKMAA